MQRSVLTLLLALWIGACFFPIATLRAVNVQDDIFTSDLLNDRLPVRAFVGESLRRGEAPFWIPGIYTGYPALGQVEIGVLYPTNVLLFGLLPDYVAMAYAQLLPLLIAGAGAAVLSLEYGLPPVAALLAGGALSLSGFFVCHIRQLNMIDAAAWVPWLMLFAERLATGGTRSDAWKLGAVWAISLLAGHPQVSYYSALVVAIYFLVRRYQVERTRGSSRLLSAKTLLTDPRSRWSVAGTALGTLSAAAALLPAAELTSTSGRSGGLSFAAASAFPVSPRAFWSFFVPYVNGDAADASFQLSGIFWEQYGYIGLLPMLLALAALVFERRDPRVRLLFGIAAPSYLMVLGVNTPLFALVHGCLPGMAYFRFPTRFLLFVEVAIALLAAFGLAHVLASIRHRRAAAVVGGLVLSITAVDLWIHQRRQVPLVDRQVWTRPIETVEVLRANIARHSGPYRYFSLDTKRLHAEVYHHSKGWSGDLSQYVAARDLLQPSFNLLFGLESPDGYANLVPRSHERLWGSDKEAGLVTPSGRLQAGSWRLAPHLRKLLGLFNVRYLVSAWPLADPELSLLASTREGVKIYEDRQAMPRAFVVGRLRRASTDEQALALLVDDGFQPEREAIVQGGDAELPPDAESSSNVRFYERSNTHLGITASLERPGLLVVSESFYPGWSARLDGEVVPLHRVNLTMRGVVLPAGTHDIRFDFRSTTIRLGFVLSAVGVAALAVWGFGWRTRA